MLLCGNVVPESQIQLVQTVFHTCDRGDRVVRCAVCLGVDKCILIGVGTPFAENMVRKVNDPLRVFAAQTDNGERPFYDACLYIFITVREDKYFVRDGQDVYLQIPISFTQAVLGADIYVPTIDGTEIKVAIPAGTESGKILRLKGKGFPFINSSQRGNMYLKIVVDVPRRLSLKARRIVKDLAEELGETDKPTPMEYDA